MVKQSIWIALAVGVFFAGIGIGYAALQSNTTTVPMTMTPQQMQQMMNDPHQMTQWHQTMRNNPQAMNQWMKTMMNDPQTMQQFHDMMINDSQHMNQMMDPMMNNPQFMNKMMGTMMNNSNFQQQYMGPWMMMRDQQFMQHMRGQWFQQSNLESLAVQTNNVSILVDAWKYQSLNAYSPSVIKVSSGATVTWTNNDAIVHTVTDLGNSFDSGLIQVDTTWDHKFDSKNTYNYFCSIHPWMRGTVIVD